MAFMSNDALRAEREKLQALKQVVISLASRNEKSLKAVRKMKNIAMPRFAFVDCS
jgi:hypothetical protein